MSHKKKPVEVVEDPEAAPAPESAAIPVVSLEEAIDPQPKKEGVTFWFGEVQRFELPKGTQFVTTVGQHTITDPELIKFLEQKSEHPSFRIFKVTQ